MAPHSHHHIDDVVAARLRQVLDTAPRTGAPDLDAEVSNGRFPQEIERLRGPLQTVALHEGLLIQSLLATRLGDEPHHEVQTCVHAAITSADRDFLARNERADLDKIAPPAAGDPVETIEIDILVYNCRSRVLTLLDVKRSPRRYDSISRMRLASLAARRRLQQELPVISTRTYLLRWWPGPNAAPPQPHVITRADVDERLALALRASVDDGVRAFRTGFAAHIRSLLDQPAGHQQMAVNLVASRADDWTPEAAVFRRVFRRGSDMGRRA